ncbi:hypothetical protein [Phycisphaera mikurensis]|uniref:O-antigen polymerase family protein n=1 Tax=Phycisphaera mikurensis (strain NBRC 102666 / KCTC 22515 / FYK2301M01) TaxID=1142394 RepID=I0ICE8_PHYMF|nr:hypothetical protein [Phycisphaera mikurensis]MBB6442187.1 hypothetical protein [Phycisphaera mikurensis]BAM02936.1 hypothetical protein PSMK_07770 [Phycisphaera mikurensis NBRC 102666]
MLTSLTMFGWIPFTLALFMVMPPKRAVVWCFFLAWLFLPMAGYKLSGLPDYTKMSASSAGVLLATALFDQGRLIRFKLRWIDAPLIMFTIVSPMASSISNGLGIYDGLSETNAWLGSWTLPWFIGRMYFKTADDMRLLATAFLMGAFAYIPICLWEMRMAPTLHRNFYGFHQHGFAHAVRWGGYRPRGFMQSGLMTSLYMCSGAVIGLILWRSRVPVRIGRTPVLMAAAVPVLAVVAFFCKGTGAIVLAVGVTAALFAAVILQTRLPMIVFMLVSPLYIIARAKGVWDGTDLVDFVARFSSERAQSLNFRFVNENVLIEKASQRPVFGWGGWNRSAVFNEAGDKTSVADGLWIILYGKAGILGMGFFMLSLILPVLMFLWRFPAYRWLQRSVAPSTALAMMLAIYQVDCLFNGMESPLNFLIAGGLSGTMLMARSPRRAANPQASGKPAKPAGGRPRGPHAKPTRLPRPEFGFQRS